MKLILALLFPYCLLAADSAIRGFPPAAVAPEQAWEAKLQSTPDPQRVRNTIQKLADKPHLAGTPASKVVAEYLAGQLREWGLDTHIEEFEALLPTPQHRVLEMTEPRSFRAKLTEPGIPGDKNSEDSGQVPPYNAYSGNGDLTAQLVYVNFGIPSDYDYLAKLGISVKDKIVIARYGESWRGVKPKLAWEHGAVGCIIYSDPHEDGYYKGDVYPKGAYRPAGGVQRGSVLDIAQFPGDPLSPGFASVPGAKRLPLSEASTLMKIPVMPISYEDAQPLLENLGGPVAPETWRGALPLTYHIGPGGMKVHLNVEMDNSTHPLYDVIARIPGTDFPGSMGALWQSSRRLGAWRGRSDERRGVAARDRAHAGTTVEGRLETQKDRYAGVLGWRRVRPDRLDRMVREACGGVERKLVAYLNSDSNARGHLSAGGSHTLESFMAELARDIKDPRVGRPLADNLRTPSRSRRPARPASDAGDDSPEDGKFHLKALGPVRITRRSCSTWASPVSTSALAVKAGGCLSFRLRRFLLVQPFWRSDL